MKWLVDTNLLLRISDPENLLYQQATCALEILRDQGHQFHSVPQNLYEYWVVATRSIADNGLGLSPREVRIHLEKVKLFFPVLRDERTILHRWETLVFTHAVLGKNAHDARLVAAMQKHGLTHLLTFNGKDFQRYPGITVLTPQEVMAGTG